jgi:hypothetical protein
MNAENTTTADATARRACTPADPAAVTDPPRQGADVYDGRAAWPADWDPHRVTVDDYLGDWVRLAVQINAAWVALAALACPALAAIRQIHAASRGPRLLDQHA